MKKQLIIGLCMLIALAFSVNAIEVTVNNYDPSPAEAGKFVNVWFKIENPTDTKTRSLDVTITPKDGFSLSTGESADKRVGILGSFTSETVQYRLQVADNTIEGPNMVTVSVQEDGSSGAIDFDLPIEVIEKDFKEVELEVGDIRSDPTRIKPGDDSVKLDVVLQNLGDTTAKGVKARLDSLPEGVTFTESYSDLELLGNIDGDGSATGSYFIDVEDFVEPKEYTARLHIDYKYKEDEDEDDYLRESKVLPVRLSIKAVPLYEITNVELDTEQLRVGQKNVKMTLTIKNVGEEEGESVRVKVYGKSEQPFSYDVSSNFVAPTLEPGQEGQATLEFDVAADASLQTYLLDVEIKNLINDDVVTYDKTVPIEVSLERQGNPIGLILGIGAVLAIIGIVVVLRRRKQAKKKSPKKVKLS